MEVHRPGCPTNTHTAGHVVTLCWDAFCAGHALACRTAHYMFCTVHNMSYYAWSKWHVKISLVLCVGRVVCAPGGGGG